MLADYDDFGRSYSGTLKQTAKLAAGMSLGSLAYVAGAIPGYRALSSLSPRRASLAYAIVMGASSVAIAHKYARQSDLAMAGTATVFGASLYTALAALYAPEIAPAAAAAPALPAGAVAGLFDLDNRQAIHDLTRLPF